MSMLVQVFGAVATVVTLYSLRRWSEAANTNISLPPTDDVWRGLAAEIGMSPGSSEIEGTLNGVRVRLRAGAGEYWITANPGALILHDMQVTDQASLSIGTRITTGDPMFDRRFKTTGDPAAVFAVLGARTRIALLKSTDPLILRGGGLNIKLPSTVSANAAVARLHALVDLVRSIVPKDPNATLLSNMAGDPSDDVRFGAFDAALKNPDLRHAAISGAAKSRWPDLRLLASDSMPAPDAETLLKALLKSTASSVVRSKVMRRAHKRADIDAQPFVSSALSSGDMSVVRTIRELGVTVSAHVEAIRVELDRAQQDPSELVLLLGPHAGPDDCPLLLQTLEQFSQSTLAVATLLAEHGGPNEAQRLNTLANDEQLDDTARGALRTAARQIAARKSGRGGAGRLGIASPVRDGAIALAEQADARVDVIESSERYEAD